ncbi:MAG: terminase small subunit [Planctomycetes bacterium]|nr:terminase small subunit [Planctomycetota bacterium]
MNKSSLDYRLTAKQRQFVNEFLIDLNATQAAMRAGYSTRTAHRIGAENLQKPAIKAEIDRAIQERSKQVKIDADQVIKRLEAIAFADFGNFVEVRNGEMIIKDTETLTPNQRAAVSGISKSKDGGVHIRMRDSIAALKLIGLHLGMFQQNQEPTEPTPIKRIILEHVPPRDQNDAHNNLPSEDL